MAACCRRGLLGKRQDEKRQKLQGSVASCRYPRGAAGCLLPHAKLALPCQPRLRKAKNDKSESVVELELQMALDELAEPLAVFLAHVDEFHAGAVLADIADHGGENDFAKAGAHFELDGVAHREFSPRLEGSASQADSPDAGEAGRCSCNLRAQRRLEQHANIAARNEVPGARLRRGTKSSGSLLERRPILDQGKRVCGGSAQARGLRIGQTVALPDEGLEELRGIGRAHASEGFDSLDADKLVAQNFVFPGGDFQKLRNRGGFLRQSDVVNHHRHNHRMRVREDRRKNESNALRRGGIRGPRELAYCQILQIPFPAPDGAREAAEQTLRVSDRQELDGRGHALAAGLV